MSHDFGVLSYRVIWNNFLKKGHVIIDATTAQGAT